MKIKKILLLLILLIPTIILDQITKSMARKQLADNTKVIIDKVFELRFLKNTGAVWGSFSSQTTMLIVITSIMLVVLLLIYFVTPEGKRYLPLNLCFLFIISGAIGNLIDRIKFHYVTDFLYFKLINFPIFNVADIYVTCSTILMAILIMFYYKDEDFECYRISKKTK